MTLALLFWGWRTNLWWFAVPMALLLDLSTLVRRKWDLREKDYCRIWDLCTLFSVGGAVYLYSSGTTPASAFLFFQWMPIFLFPMALGQAYGSGENLKTRVFSWFLRKRAAASEPINVSWFFLALCCVAAGAANLRDPWFYIGVVILAGLSLSGARPSRFSFHAWATCFVFASLLGYFAHGQIHQLQGYLEQKTAEAFSRFMRKEFDPAEMRTTMGQIGNQKQSSRIVLRVNAVEGPVPSLLRSASYTTFQDATWRVVRGDFSPLPTESDTTTWNLPNTNRTPSLVQIACYPPPRRAVLALPNGAARILNAPVNAVETNRLGTARVLEAPGLLSYRVHFDEQRSFDGEPDNADFEIPTREWSLITDIAKQLGLSKLSDDEKRTAIVNYFEKNFRYTTDLPASRSRSRGKTPLTIFLKETHAGHCEYFATAATLLLRAAHIPARYATGYSVQERHNDTYFVRDRHAHAWSLYFENGSWHDLDATPAGWGALEQKEASLFEPVRDLFSGIWYRFSLWRWNADKSWINSAVLFSVAGAGALLSWRLFFRKRTPGDSSLPKKRQIGADSELFLIEKALARKKLHRSPHETFRQWFQRLRHSLPAEQLEKIEPILVMHYKYRFDPGSLTGAERMQLKTSAREWLR
ncbi:MAG: transglutaminase-like enzyme predicted cysteine protease [Verrucomicrobiales bacterium]|nr:transglutaminase-like enzyme predicted cysteine protease [Verrucomicrobiales bacterium]